MANLPKSIQAQVDAADAILAQSGTLDGLGNPVDAKPAEEAPEPQAEAPVPAVQHAAPEPANQHDVWEARYKSLQGLFNQQVPELQRQVKDLNSRYQNAIEQLEKTAKREPEQQAKPTVDPKDVDAFGVDLVEMVQRVTRQSLGGITAKMDGLLSGMQQRMAQIEQQLHGTSQTVAYTAEQTFFSQLAKVVPDWEKINADQRFLTWLGEVDPLLGTNRQAALDSAQKAMDSGRVAAIFKAFERTLPQAPAKQANTLAKQITPSSVASAAPQPTDKPILTQAQIQAYYKDVATGKYRGRDQEAAKLEAMINSALAENRVR